MISEMEGCVVLVLFALCMFGLVWAFSGRKSTSSESFLIADRKISWIRGAFSIAVSWVWAPAIFVASLQAYTKGIAGAFWFIVPNILCFFVFTPVAVKVRKILPRGYTLPEYVLQRFDGDKKVHLAFLFLFFGYQFFAITVNSLAGGTLLHILTGINFSTAVVSLSLVALTYSLVSGLKASVLTDIVQMSFILVLAMILVPWVISEAGGFSTLEQGLGGISGIYGNIFDPEIAYSFGIPMTFALISGPLVDQMFFQRSFAVQEKDIVKTFIAGGLIFGFVPILLALLGFIAASPDVAASLVISDPQMVAPLVIGNYLPRIALLFFVFMAFAGLCSTLDSAYCAISALGSVDIYKRYVNPKVRSKDLLSISRAFMLGLALAGTTIALFQPKILWLFLISGAMASAGFFPIVLSVFWEQLTKEAAYYGIVFSLIFGLPLSIYANLTENTDLIVLSAILSVGIGLVVCVVATFTYAYCYFVQHSRSNI